MASPSSPVDQYRAQQGMAPVTHSYDPKLVSWIKQAAAATGADPAALLATSLQESGARLNGPAGDAGTSFGPFQFHRGGALGNHTPEWASTYEAVLNRAQEFAKGQVHHGKGAAAVQRPADRRLYARGVDSFADEARAILGKGLAQKKKPKAPRVTDTVDHADEGPLMLEALAQLHPNSGGSGIQQALNSNAALAGIAAPTLPVMGQAASTPTVAPPASHPKAPKPQPLFTGRVTPGKPKIIGTPYSGTHRLGNWESDNAVDIALAKGTPIRAPFGGVVGSRIGSLGSSSPRMAGLRVHLQGQGQELYFAHLSRLNVKAGERVKPGQIIGWSGVANGVAHLHLGAKTGNPGRYA